MNTFEGIDDLFEDSYRDAQDIIDEPGKIERTLERLEKKLRGLPILNDTLSYIPKMGMLLNSYIKKEYTQIPLGIIIAIAGAILYFISPLDLIPDFIPLAGYLDDAAVVGSALKLVKSDLDEYMIWRCQNGYTS